MNINALNIEAKWVCTAAASGQADLESKPHIVWNMRKDLVDKYFNEHAEPPECKQIGGSVSDIEDFRSALECDAELMAVTGTGVMNTASPNHVRTPYHKYSHVEYYSQTNCSWIHGRILRQCCMPADTPSNPVKYDIAVSRTGQVRRFVPMNLLRMPLRRNEPCEVLSNKMDQWLPAFVAGEQQITPSLTGYRIRLCSGELVRADIGRVRRRFPAGSNVEVYLEAEGGWARAIVVESWDTNTNIELAEAGANDAIECRQRAASEPFSNQFQAASVPVQWRCRADTEPLPPQPRGGLLEKTRHALSSGTVTGFVSRFDEVSEQPLVVNHLGQLFELAMWAQVQIRICDHSGRTDAMTASAHLLRFCDDTLHQAPVASPRDAEPCTIYGHLSFSPISSPMVSPRSEDSGSTVSV